MRRGICSLLLLALWSLTAASCGDVCDRLPKLTEDRCGIDATTPDNSGDETVCAGEAEVAARCADDNKAAYCEWLQAFAAGDVEFENDYTACVEAGG